MAAPILPRGGGRPLRVLELYSGIGGMHYALLKACPPQLRKEVAAV